MIVIVGLGNPGKIYEHTYHNLGYMALDYFAEKHAVEFTKNKYHAKVAEFVYKGEKVVLLKPETFMNLSGKSVIEVCNMHKLDTSQLMVVLDDIDLPFGNLRVRSKGSAGTHNGLRDIVGRIGENFARVRIGAGRPDENIDLATYVLSKIPNDRLKNLDATFEKTAKIIDVFIENKSLEGIDINKI